MFSIRTLHVCFLVLCGVFAAAFPVYSGTGNYFEVGQSIGAQAAAQIRQRLARSDVNKTIKPFLATSTGKFLFNNFHRAAADRVPHLVEELRGMASGSEQSFDDIFIQLKAKAF